MGTVGLPSPNQLVGTGGGSDAFIARVDPQFDPPSISTSSTRGTQAAAWAANDGTSGYDLLRSDTDISSLSVVASLSPTLSHYTDGPVALEQRYYYYLDNHPADVGGIIGARRCRGIRT